MKSAFYLIEKTFRSQYIQFFMILHLHQLFPFKWEVEK